MEDIATLSLLFLMAAAFVAGFIDAISGGGGLVTMPALLLVGIPPIPAIATNKLQAVFGSVAATAAYAKSGYIDLRKQWPSVVVNFFAAVLGAFTATQIPTDILKAVLPVILIVIAVYFAFKPKLDDHDRAQVLGPFAVGFLVTPVIAFYDGMFGPGGGSFFTLTFVSLAGFGMIKAAAHTKVLNFASNLGSLVFFIFAGAVYWKIGFAMGITQFLGARLGAALAMKKGAKIIKPLLTTICVIMAAKLLFDPANPLRIWLGI